MNAIARLLPALLVALCANPATARQPAIDSLYTGLTDAECSVLEINEEEGWSKSRCNGVAGFALTLSDSDARQTLDVVVPDGKRYPLELWSVVSRAFSTLGAKAEWRVRKEGGEWRPFALIVRFNAAEDPQYPDKLTSYLVVSKITDQSVCVTDVIGPQSGANQQARELADKAASRPCMPPL